MKQPLLSLAAVICLFATLAWGQSAETAWKAGVARAVITPKEPMWMAGYGGRTKPAEGKEMDLLIRVVALEAANEHRAVILSSDTLGFPKPMYDAIAERLEKEHKLTRAQFVLGAS